MRVEVNGVEYVTRQHADALAADLARDAREARRELQAVKLQLDAVDARSARAERDGLAATLKTMTRARDDLRGMLEAAHRDLRQERDARNTAHVHCARQRDGLAATLQAVTNERDDARMELDRRNRQLCKERDELDGLRAELAAAKRQLADERGALADLAGDYTYMTRDEARRLKDRGDALEGANAELVRELAVLREVNDSLRSVNKDLVGQNARLTTGNMRLRAARDFEHRRVDRAAPAAPRVEIRSETLARMQRRVTAQGARISALRAGLRAIARASSDTTRGYVANVLSDDDARKNAAG